MGAWKIRCRYKCITEHGVLLYRGICNDDKPVTIDFETSDCYPEMRVRGYSELTCNITSPMNDLNLDMMMG